MMILYLIVKDSFLLLRHIFFQLPKKGPQQSQFELRITTKPMGIFSSHFEYLRRQCFPCDSGSGTASTTLGPISLDVGSE